MQSNAKANSIVTSRYDAERNVIVFTVLGCGDTELDLNKVSQANSARAAVHGWNQRIPDAAAIGQADKDGNIIPKAERNRIKYERMNDLCRFYESGTDEWSRKGSGGGSAEGSLTIQAIARVKAIDYAAAETLVQLHADMHNRGDRKKALAFLATGKRVAAAMAEIRNERAAAQTNLDADALLDSMGEPAPTTEE